MPVLPLLLFAFSLILAIGTLGPPVTPHGAAVLRVMQGGG